ncbi:regulatory factor Sgt1 [Coccidioides immitis RS]|uniref:Regulatory factor Sgt1 n=2 Tax=Coccidioides immitis TaxID=5501 RepID=A0A0E1S029_COCIM|nr:regulatory factor Sgt1 [Coccidioides immitis RS]EAS36537.1 regulatory factor Sgt1 [Coccidioides immitis RS]KMP01898.1 ecdysoneless [Coccidioides immitis RMSCC 2394]TPX25352.1 hypothetical protein DIZ76_010804 [Coccidioides immitis]
MAPMSQEDIEWFKSTFHPIPKPELPEDCVEYSLYCISGDATPGSEDEPVASRAALSKVQKAASELVKEYLRDYIWQREGFKLEQIKEDGVNLLRGRTEYGDSIEDEWVIVFLLRELTRKFHNLWVKVTDNDGEFLLVEAAASLPPWLEDPGIASNRVWIHRGELVIIGPPTTARAVGKKLTEKLAFRDARKIILNEPTRLMRSPTIEEEAFYRLRNYPDQITKNMHSSLATVPRTIAHLLHMKAAYVSPAVEAFYIRDPISLRVLQSNDQRPLFFDPTDLVTVSVRFTKTGFAQLKSQDFDPPKQWKPKLLFDPESKEYSRAEVGMKLTCGFEMLLFDPQNQDKPVVREIKLVLEDIEAGDDKLPSDEEIAEKWDRREDDESWLDINYEDLESELKGRKEAGDNIKMGDFGDKTAQENLQRIVAQFEKFLNDDSAGFEGADFFSESDDSEIDEEELSSDGEDKEASFDEEEFSRMMREMMGLPSTSSGMTAGPRRDARVEELESSDEENEKEASKQSSRPPQQTKPILKESEIMDSNRKLREELQNIRQGLSQEELDFSDEEVEIERNKHGHDDDGEDNDEELEEIQELSRQMEAELKKAGVLDPNRVLREESKRKNRSLKGKAPIRNIEDADTTDDDDHGDSDVDVNLARNLLESLRSQGGAAGPGSNLLGMMGMKMPKDDRGQ